MNTYTVFGHVLAKKLPKASAVIGDGWLRFLPGSPRDGGGTSLQHVSMDPEIDYASTIPAHMMIHSRWQVGFQNISASSDEDAVEKVRRTKVPQFKAAYHFATGDTIDVVLSGIGNEKTDEPWSPWSSSSRFHFNIPEELEQEEMAASRGVV